MQIEKTTAARPVAARAAAAPAPQVRAAAMAADQYAGRPASQKTNLAQPIGMGMFVVGALGGVMARGNIFMALIGLAAAGLALAGSGVKVQLPDGSTGTAGFKGASVILPGVGLAVGGAAALALGLSGVGFVAVAAVPFVLAMLASQTLLK